MIKTSTVKTPRGWAVAVVEYNSDMQPLSAVVVFSNAHVERLQFYETPLEDLVTTLTAGETRAQRNKLDAPIENKNNFTPPPREEERNATGSR